MKQHFGGRDAAKHHRVTRPHSRSCLPFFRLRVCPLPGAGEASPESSPVARLSSRNGGCHDCQDVCLGWASPVRDLVILRGSAVPRGALAQSHLGGGRGTASSIENIIVLAVLSSVVPRAGVGRNHSSPLSCASRSFLLDFGYGGV
jgi:hypothetical protein